MHTSQLAPAFQVANAGYDVWLGNSRGNKYSRHHIKYNPDWSNEFWYFDWETMGDHDIPSVTDYILKITG